MNDRKTYILVFTSPEAWVLRDTKPIASILKAGDGFYALDGNIVFIRTEQDIDELNRQLSAGPLGSGSFFLSDITSSGWAGKMTPTFWRYLETGRAIESAA